MGITHSTPQLKDLGSPFYVGSVQSLYEVPSDPSLMVAETGSGGSVFDVGTIFEIPESDRSRALFRHVFYSKLAAPETWASVRKALESNSSLDPVFRDRLLGQTLSELEERGAKTHHAGMVDGVSGELVVEGLPSTPSACNAVRRYTVHTPPPAESLWGLLYDYGLFTHADQYVVPLECIVRFGLTDASSVYKKYTALSGDAAEKFARDLAGSDSLSAWQPLARPVLDFTSKFEPTDRAVTRQEAFIMSGLGADNFLKLADQAFLHAFVLREVIAGMGLQLWDLKWEFASDGEDLVLVDTIDTDSVRATLTLEEGGRPIAMHINKQAMRDYYEIMHPDWVAGVAQGKADALAAAAPFQEFFNAGQEAGSYPSTPEIDPGFLEIQTNKNRAILAHLIDPTAQETPVVLREIAQTELAYYMERGKFPELLQKSALPMV